MTTYTDKLKLKHSDLGAVDWKDEEDGNRKTIDSTVSCLLTDNKVISGCGVVDSGGLTVDVAAGVVLINGQLLDVSADTLTLTAGEGAGEQQNWVYVDGSGTAQDGPAPPTGTFVLLAVVDTSDADVLRIADVRPMGNDLFVRESTIIYIATTGSDTTGDGSATNPVYSINAAMALLSDKRILPGVTVTLSIADGSYSFSTPTTLEHPDGKSINLIGNETTVSNVDITLAAVSGETFYLYQIEFGRIAGMTVDNNNAGRCFYVIGSHILEFDNVDSELMFEITESSIVDNIGDVVCGGEFGVYRNSYTSIAGTFSCANFRADEGARVEFSGDITCTSASYPLRVSRNARVFMWSGTLDILNATSYGIYTSYAGVFFTKDSSDVDTGSATVPYSPSLTTGNTPTYGNIMGINIAEA